MRSPKMVILVQRSGMVGQFRRGGFTFGSGDVRQSLRQFLARHVELGANRYRSEPAPAAGKL
jgi:hypothetical protein